MSVSIPRSASLTAMATTALTCIALLTLPAATYSADGDPAVPAAGGSAVPAAAPSAEPAPIVHETFDGPGLPAGFTAVEGSWTVAGGKLVGTGVGGQLSRITFGQHLRDFRIEVTARFETVENTSRWTAMGLDIAASGATPWAIATMRSNTLAPNGLEFAQRTEANTWNVTDTGSAQLAAGTGRDVHIAAEVHGSAATWFVDGQPRLKTSRLARGTGGQGLLIAGAKVSFDDLTVTALPRESLIRAPGAPFVVIGHRGASSAAPENTLVSDEVARRGGAQYIENDVQPSKDGTPWVIHDGTVDRTTDGTGAIRALTDAQLAGLDAGSWFAPVYTGTRIPTLAAQLDDLRTRGGDLLLEIKGPHTRDQVARIIKEIRDHGMIDRVFVQSFEIDALRYTYELAPELPLGLLRGSLDADPVGIAKELHLTAYNPSDEALQARPSVVGDLHAAGVAVMVWTPDSAARWQALFDWGVDGIITNRPAELSGWNAGLTTIGAPKRPTLSITSPTGELDRAQRPVLAVQTTDTTSTSATVDGTPVAVGEPLDLTTAALGEHTVSVTATGPAGSTTSTITVALRATPTGLAHLILTKVPATQGDKLLGALGSADYAELIRRASKIADPAVRELVIGDATALR